jgi:uncharacterized protein (TIGR00369 family)
MARTDRGLALIDQYCRHNAFVDLLGFEFETHEDGVVCYSLKIQPKHLATPGFTHGGVLTTLLDATMGAGALTLVADDGQVVSTIEMQVNFIQAVHLNDLIICRSKVIRKGKKVIFMAAEIRNEHNQLIAVSNGSFYPFAAEKAGYI